MFSGSAQAASSNEGFPGGAALFQENRRRVEFLVNRRGVNERPTALNIEIRNADASGDAILRIAEENIDGAGYRVLRRQACVLGCRMRVHFALAVAGRRFRGRCKNSER